MVVQLQQKRTYVLCPLKITIRWDGKKIDKVVFLPIKLISYYLNWEYNTTNIDKYKNRFN